MAKIYCTKCGVRGSSKCPHCRSIFGSSPEKIEQKMAQEYFEMFASVRLQKSEDQALINEGKDARFQVAFWTYELGSSEALYSVLYNLREYLPLVNLDVAACVHDWQLIPGETSSIGCGCESAPVGTIVPPDPYAAS